MKYEDERPDAEAPVDADETTPGTPVDEEQPEVRDPEGERVAKRVEREGEGRHGYVSREDAPDA